MKAVVLSKSDLNFMQYFQGDKKRYIQIMANFISNAIKNSVSKGSVTVKFEIIEKQKVDVLSNSSSVLR